MGHGYGLRTRATISLWLAGTVLGGAACRNDHIAGPSDPDGAAAAPSLATVAATLAFSKVSAGGLHTCGLTTEGQIYCWGLNDVGSLGDGTTEDRAVPTLVVHTLRFRQVSAGVSHTCAISTDNRAWCWGSNRDGALGDGSTAEKSIIPVAVAGNHPFRQISAGEHHTCALTPTTTNRIYCWGTGILGDGSGSSKRPQPHLVSGSQTYLQVTAGSQHTCALSSTNNVLCWGRNSSGQLGNRSTGNFVALTPVAVAGTRQYLQVSAGWYHTCAVTMDKKAYCWGLSSDGQVGDNGWTRRFAPRAVAGGLSFDRVSLGAYHSCGETTSNQAYCWGFN